MEVPLNQFLKRFVEDYLFGDLATSQGTSATPWS
jgi:hypothetical protein